MGSKKKSIRKIYIHNSLLPHSICQKDCKELMNMAIQYNKCRKIQTVCIGYGLLTYSVNSILSINSFFFFFNSLVLLSKCCLI